jgi:hypothetical protein
MYVHISDGGKVVDADPSGWVPPVTAPDVLALLGPLACAFGGLTALVIGGAWLCSWLGERRRITSARRESLAELTDARWAGRDPDPAPPAGLPPGRHRHTAPHTSVSATHGNREDSGPASTVLSSAV